MTALLLLGYFYYMPWESAAQLVEARTQLFTAMILMELANAVAARSLKYPVYKVGIFKNRYLWYAIISSMLLQLFVLYTPGIQGIFGVNSPGIVDWALAIVFTIIVFGSLELGKYVSNRRRKI
jgi:magnesium-transporting ATPase (P-type)